MRVISNAEFSEISGMRKSRNKSFEVNCVFSLESDKITLIYTTCVKSIIFFYIWGVYTHDRDATTVYLEVAQDFLQHHSLSLQNNFLAKRIIKKLQNMN
jgi:hypothetical protein